MSSRGLALIHERLRQLLEDQVTQEAGRPALAELPMDLLVRHVTSTFVLVLNWWLESRSELPPAQVDAVFRALVTPTLAAALD